MTQSSALIPLLTSEIKVDGVLDEDAWRDAYGMDELTSPWIKYDFDKTKFRAYFTSKYFNFFFNVEDNLLITFPFENESSVLKNDRVELFFSKDLTLEDYYCIEINPEGNILDYSAETYRNFKESWNFKSREIATKITDSGYIVEGKILVSELRELGIEDPFYLGIFRADFKDYNSKEVTWFSWVTPLTAHPDFHIPSAFGKVEVKE